MDHLRAQIAIVLGIPASKCHSNSNNGTKAGEGSIRNSISPVLIAILVSTMQWYPIIHLFAYMLSNGSKATYK